MHKEVIQAGVEDMASAEAVEIQQLNRVALLRFNPGDDGTMSLRTAAALLAAVECAIKDDTVGVIVLTGAQSDVFIRHYSVKEILRTAQAIRKDPAILESASESPTAKLYATCANAPKPIIAAINGTCMGGGFELALCCTRRVIQSSVTQVGLPETRIGIIPGAGGTQRLPRLIGEARAMQFVLDGEVVNADTALALGLVDDIADDAVAAALAVAERWAGQSPQLLAAVLQTVRGATDRSPEEGTRLETGAFLGLLQEDDTALKKMQHYVDGNAGLGDYEG